SFVSSVATLVYGGLTTIRLVLEAFGHGDFSERGAKLLAAGLVGTIDLFLLGTVLYITAVGLYELFIDPSLPMPAWLRITTLDDLKERLLAVVVVLLAVSFLDDVVTWDRSASILPLGLSVGLVIGTIALTLAVLSRAHAPAAPAPGEPPQPRPSDPAPRPDDS
ncbi:MAG TPA: YqhA family protein, partial [Chloroflexota bacterium]|nr:YqhA family protein [Chloroflexota bacterium]